MQKEIKKILIIDDEQMQLRLLSSYVTRMGYVAFTAKNIMEASEALNHEEIDLIVLDLNIPQVSGYSILGLLASKNIEIPIVICSSTLHLVSDVEFIHANKSYKFLNKPVTFDVFIETIHASLSGKADQPTPETQPESSEQTPAPTTDKTKDQPPETAQKKQAPAEQTPKK